MSLGWYSEVVQDAIRMVCIVAVVAVPQLSLGVVAVIAHLLILVGDLFAGLGVVEVDLLVSLGVVEVNPLLKVLVAPLVLDLCLAMLGEMIRAGFLYMTTSDTIDTSTTISCISTHLRTGEINLDIQCHPWHRRFLKPRR